MAHHLLRTTFYFILALLASTLALSFTSIRQDAVRTSSYRKLSVSASSYVRREHAGEASRRSAEVPVGSLCGLPADKVLSVNPVSINMRGNVSVIFAGIPRVTSGNVRGDRGKFASLVGRQRCECVPPPGGACV